LGDLGGSGYIAWLKVNPATNAVIIMDPPGYYNATDDFLISWDQLSSTGYSPAWSGSSQCNNTYDPATKNLLSSVWLFRLRWLQSNRRKILTKQ